MDNSRDQDYYECRFPPPGIRVELYHGNSQYRYSRYPAAVPYYYRYRSMSYPGIDTGTASAPRPGQVRDKRDTDCDSLQRAALSHGMN